MDLDQLLHKVESNMDKHDGKKLKLKYKMVYPISIDNPDIIVQKKVSTIRQVLYAFLHFKLEICQLME